MACISWCSYDDTLPTKDDPDSVLVTWEIELSTFSNWFRNKILGTFSGESFTPPTQLYIACHTTTSSVTAAGTEVDDANYTRTAVTFERVSDIKRWNPAQVATAGFAGAESILSMSLWDSATIGHGNYYAFGNLSETLSVTAGQSVVWPANKVLVGMGAQA